ncbi:peptidoglycan-binding protein [Aquihabitans daechungensis]|uniref:peptidoglycan-binding domain-containing protein n=1 Tax=Aquihabitans daechungensis TaxID=1052257 RepID=UPI003BA2B005
MLASRGARNQFGRGACSSARPPEMRVGSPARAQERRTTVERRPWVRLVAGLSVGALALVGCGSSTDDRSERTPVEKAEAKVDRAEADHEDAQAAFDQSSKVFCSDAADAIGVLDQYGRILHQDAVTVDEVRSGADDLRTARDAVGDSADQAVGDHQAVLEAEAAVAAATAELDAAKAAAAGGTTVTTSSEDTTTTTTAPLVPKETTDRVAAAEEALRRTSASTEGSTPVVDAGLQFGSAAFAVEVAWLRLFADAGCLTTDEQAAAVTAVTDYTEALQRDLAAVGLYTGPLDGVYGPSTVTAVEALQKQALLPVTGLTDTATERALDAAVAQTAGSAAVGVTSRTAAIQGALKVLGYWDGPVDGKPSPALTDAIVQLQIDLGVEPTGIVDPATLEAVATAVDQAKDDATTTTAQPPTTAPEASSTTAPATTAPPG